MTRAQFLNDLYRRLAGNGMNEDQAEQHLTYYAEMLADRMEEGMSEDQAVASMEDVDTIARRILEEEGKSYRPPEEAVTPPVYPDASKLGGGGGKRAYQAPRKWNGRRLAQIALWALAVVIALGAVSRWAWRRGVPRYHDDTSITAVDYTSSAPVEETAVPKAPYVEWDEAYVQDAPYAMGYEYGGGENYVAAAVSAVDIQWAAGMVYIQSWSGDNVMVMEYSQSELSERTAMDLQTDGDALKIRYRQGTSLGSVKGSKWLTVLVPDGMLAELDIETTSAEVQMQGLEVNELDVSTASGDIYASGCYTQSAELETVSGDMNLTDLYAVELDLGTTSGDLWGTVVSDDLKAGSISGDITLNTSGTMETASLKTTSGYIQLYVEDDAAQSIDMSAVSGDITLVLPYDMGFTLDYSTVSGSLSDSFDTVQRDGKYVYNGGGCKIEVETVSGNLDIY